MHYLKCINLFNYLLDKLHAGQRQQAPISVIEEIQNPLLHLTERLNGERIPEVVMRTEDILRAINEIRSTAGLTALTDTMKRTLVDGISELKTIICTKAFKYFQTVDFEPSPEIVPLMREVVSVALQKGEI